VSFSCHPKHGKKVKKYNLVSLSKQENVRRQIANIIALELSNYDSKLDRLTDYVLKKLH
jgi:hypothetical protein